MSDFFLDLRPRHERRHHIAADQLRHFPDISTTVFEEEGFALAVTRADDLATWGPATSSEAPHIVALIGRLVPDARDRAGANRREATGGSVTKTIGEAIRSRGADALTQLNGNFAVITFDRNSSTLTLVTDRAGTTPVFVYPSLEAPTVIASHPDVLAAAVGQTSNIDKVSIAEFLCTGKVTPPFTYYARILGLAGGSRLKLLIQNDQLKSEKSTYFTFDYRPEPERSARELSEELKNAFTRAVGRRCSTEFGLTAVALSGGLDSRTVLALCPEGVKLASFCFYDSENAEFRTAREIARRLKVPFHALPRAFDHYGSTAEQGIRIYGGMGSFVNNHFLGFRKAIRDIGAGNILTGFYCDYMFKGLAQNVRRNRWTRTERLAPFDICSYRPHSWYSTALSTAARERTEKYFPTSIRDYRTEVNRLRAEAKRVFPLYYEPDNAEATIPQRVMPWFLPTADTDVLDCYLRLPASCKPNASLYSVMVESATRLTLSGIPDNNTGTVVNAGQLRQAFAFYASAVKDRIERLHRPPVATSGSWPNWRYYAENSTLLDELWARPASEASSLLAEAIGRDPTRTPGHALARENLEVYLRMLTIKLWLECRIR
jgi:hypothetical protein